MVDHVPAQVFPPGEFIRDELDERGWTQKDLAEILDRPVQVVNEIISARKAITPETARGLGDAFGTGAKFWLNLESVYRLSLAQQGARDVARRARLYTLAPIADMAKRRWISASSNIDDLEQEIIRFYGLTSIEERPRLTAAARKSASYDDRTAPEMAWFHRAKHLAATLDAPPFDPPRLVTRLPELRRFAASINGIREVPEFLRTLGVRLVVVEHLPRTHMDGGTLWLDQTSPVIALSLRYGRIDWFWFTLAHELSHIRNMDGLDSWVLDSNLVGKGCSRSSEKPEGERRADQMASELLVPRAELDGFVRRVRPRFSKKSIVQFANRIGVHPGIVVGQLQHREEIGWTHGREMLEDVRNMVTELVPTDGWGCFPALDERRT